MSRALDFQILVVDDEPVTRVRVRSALEEFGYADVREAADGLEAQSFLEKHPDVDLVITDILMPGLDGIELLRWGREHVPAPEWILLSGVDTFDAAVEAIRSGAFDFIPKPPVTEALEVSVRNALEQRRLRAERDRLYHELEDANKELLGKVRELEDKSQLLQRDLERAEVIQRALLPTAPPLVDRYCIHSIYRPGRFVGGDLYDVARLDDRHLGIYIADATGHGVTAAMLSVLFKQRLMLVDDESGRPLSPAAVLENANRSLIEAVVAPGLFLTAVYGLLDTSVGEIVIASAGHPPVLHVNAAGETRLIKRTGPALGLTTDAQYGEVRLPLKVDDRLLLYTDGMIEAEDGLDVQEMCRMLGSDTGDSDALLVRLMANSRNGAEEGAADERDDVTLLLLDVHAGSSHFDNGAAPSKSRTRRRIAAPRADVLFYGEREETSFIAVRGRAIWTHADALFEAATSLLQTGRRLVLDLADCEYMDSTCLGTMHELAVDGDLKFQGVTPQVRELFEELSMQAVLDRIQPAEELPEMHPLAVPEEGGTSSPLRILRAHEVLAELSTQNKEKFEQVVDSLRSEIDSGSER